MGLVGKVILGIVLLVLLALAAVVVTGNGSMLRFGWAFLFGGPSAPFDANDAVAPPDYALPENWAALPSRSGPEDMLPVGVVADFAQGQAPVDVFFIHPTGYLRGNSWTFNLDPDTGTEENTRWMLANQASAYNGCCNVYAPRYRQANIFAYFKEPEVREEVLAFAYTDVARAFEYFLQNFNLGRPFIIASHSQGTHHGVRLLAEQIDGTPLAQRMVAAYLIGGGLAADKFESMQDITLCDSPTATGCAVHWDTYSEAVIDEPLADRSGNVCVNPLTWKVNGGRAGVAEHAGGVPGSGRFQIALSGADVATGVVFEPLQAAVPNMLEAECRNGVLYITDLGDTVFADVGGSFGGGNYHGLDYPVFHMDIRENAQQRVAAFFSRGFFSTNGAAAQP